MIEEIRRLTPSPIVVLSYLRDDADMLKAIECGADEFCITPIRQLEFAAHVRALLRRSKPDVFHTSLETISSYVVSVDSMRKCHPNPT